MRRLVRTSLPPTPALLNHAGAPLPRQGLEGPKGAMPRPPIGSVLMAAGCTGAGQVLQLVLRDQRSALLTVCSSPIRRGVNILGDTRHGPFTQQYQLVGERALILHGGHRLSNV